MGTALDLGEYLFNLGVPRVFNLCRRLKRLKEDFILENHMDFPHLGLHYFIINA